MWWSYKKLIFTNLQVKNLNIFADIIVIHLWEKVWKNNLFFPRNYILCKAATSLTHVCHLFNMQWKIILDFAIGFTREFSPQSQYYHAPQRLCLNLAYTEGNTRVIFCDFNFREFLIFVLVNLPLSSRSFLLGLLIPTLALYFLDT